MKFTTSWDDGHPLDLKLASLLAKYGLTGTTYIAKSHEYVPNPLTHNEIVELSQVMEIGAHTLTHPELTSINKEQVLEEISGSKKWLESIIQSKCDSFCYPRGKYNKYIRQAVIDAGFIGARSTQNYCFSGSDPFTLPSTIHLYPFPIRPVKNRRFLSPIKNSWQHLNNLHIPLTKRFSWLQMTTAIFNYALNNNAEWFHLRGHSWEIEKYSQWDDFEYFLEYAANTDITPVTNREIMASISL